MPDEKVSVSHNLIMQERKKLVLGGVCDVYSFSEELVIIETTMGELTIKGEGLHIDGFNRETGDMQMNGRVVALAYTGDGKKSGSLFGRIFR